MRAAAAALPPRRAAHTRLVPWDRPCWLAIKIQQAACMQRRRGIPASGRPRGPDDGPRERCGSFFVSGVLRLLALERCSVTPTVKPHCLGFPTDNHIFEHIAPVGRPSSPARRRWGSYFRRAQACRATPGEAGGHRGRQWGHRNIAAQVPQPAVTPPCVPQPRQRSAENSVKKRR